MKWRFQRNALLLALFTAGAAAAQTQTLSEPLGEQVVMVPKGAGRDAIALETTIVRPPGTGPFPVVLINHGKAEGDTRLQVRARYVLAAREFLQRGYLVVVPMRQGFSKSGGAYIASPDYRYFHIFLNLPVTSYCFNFLMIASAISLVPTAVGSFLFSFMS